MPLSPPVGRQHLHTRRVTCQGFFREDGLWDIEGRITDEKSYEHANEWRGPLKPGDFVHDMSIRLTLDHKFTIVDVEAVTDKSPYQICGDVAPDFKKLIGLRIGGGFHREVRARLGGVHGCTHIVELLGPVATTAFQTVSSRKARDLNQAHRAKTGSLPKPAKAETPSQATTQALRDRHLSRLGRRRAGREALGAAILHRPRRRSRPRRRGRQENRDGRLALRPVLAWRQRGERERMQAGGELVLQRGVDQPLARHPALPFERRRHDLDAEVGLAAFTPTGVAVMARGFVLDGKACRRELRTELVVNRHRDLAHHLPLLPRQTVEHILAECPDGERNP